MNSQRGTGTRADLSDKGKAIANMDPVTCDMSNLVIENQDDGWEVISKKNRNRSGPTSAPPPVPPPVRQAGPYSTPQPRWGGNGSGRGRNGSGSGFVNLNSKSAVNLVPNSGSNPNPWPVTPDPRKPLSRVNPRLQLVPPQKTVPPPSNPVVQPPLPGGWNWAARLRSAGSQPDGEVVPRPPDSDPE